MYADNKQSITAMELLLEVLNTVNRIGMDNTITVLKTAGDKLLKKSEADIDFILTVICSEYDVTKQSILFGTGSLPNKTHATDVFFYCVAKFLGLNHKIIGNICSLSRPSVTQGIGRITKLDPTNRIDKPKTDLIFKVEQIIKEYLDQKTK